MTAGADDSPTVAPSAAIAASSATRRRFTTGAVLQDRYRIVGLLGSGGMGEVYRADDLKLEHPVALKFLPPDRAFDPVWLARFHNEVRVARQVSHPAVCRIFDIGQIHGEHFLSMEYVDGEDLSSLLRRIGRLPADKGLEIARQLCAGLAAAHDIGVLHRDLKPANVMIDGRGRVKITDFGLAEFADRISTAEIAGTPGYMAPEVRRGGAPSVASDVFALGLVLHEIFTGKPAAAAAPSTVVRDLDPAIERVILRCLEHDAKARPVSALAVSAALPGGDPIAAALAAGETPSPEMVAAAGAVGGLPPAIAWGLALFAIAAVVALAAGNSFALYRVAPFDKSPEILAEQARAILRQAAFDGSAVDRAVGFAADDDYTAYVAERMPLTAQTDAFRRGRPPALLFWYRQAPVGLITLTPAMQTTRTDPPLVVPDMALVVLDTSGRLVELTTVPPALDSSPPSPSSTSWTPLFAAAELDESRFAAVPAQWTPPVYADARAAWEGPLPGQDGMRLRVEAASYRGRPVWFKLVAPWSRPTSALLASDLQDASRASQLFVVAFLVSISIGSALLARRNFVNGRGDRRGAIALGATVFLARFVAMLFGAHHVPSAVPELLIVSSALAWSAFTAGAVWILYLALEPFVRRRWPELIISWARLLSGRIRDPLVGRDLLIGAALGGLHVLTVLVIEWSGRRLGVGGLSDHSSGIEGAPFLGLGGRIALVGAAVQGAMNLSLVNMFVLTLLTMIFRRRGVATALFFVILGTGFVLGVSSALDRVEMLVSAAIITVVVSRFGLLAMAASFMVWMIAMSFPMTLELSVWYAGAALFAPALVVVLVGYALYTCLGGRPFAGLRLIVDA